MAKLNIGIIGSGNIGGGLARNLAKLGHDVLIANSRGPSTLAQFAEETGARASTVEEAAKARDIVIVSIPQRAIEQLPKGLFAGSSAVIVDTGNYYPARDDRIAAIEEGLTESEWTSCVLGHPVVKAFNNIAADSLARRGVPKGTPGRICLPVAGDSEDEKKIVLELIDDLGFDAIDAGTLHESWRQQPGTPAYTRDFDASSLRSALQSAEPDKVQAYREAANEAAGAYFS
jgi:predicted dinucleotide-binding enzyme